MKKSTRFKVIISALVISVLWTLVSSWPAMADVVCNPPELTYQVMTLPYIMSSGNILVDNFEYWDSPRNPRSMCDGWRTNEPPYPIWGYGIGYGQLVTILDFQEGSRVLDVYMAPSVFLPNIQRLVISKSVFRPDPNNTVIGPENGYLSFKIRAPLAIEMFNTFTFMVMGTLRDDDVYDEDWEGQPFRINLIPRENVCATIEETATLTVDPAMPDLVNVNVNLGRQYADGTWHIVYVNLNNILRNALDIPIDDDDDDPLASSPIESINSVAIAGNMYRLDDIIFHSHDHIEGDPPYLFKIGPTYAQLFTPMQRIIYATDDFCHPYDVYTDPNDIRAAWLEDLEDPDDIADIDCNIPVFVEQHMRTSDYNHAEDMLRFQAYIGGGGPNGSYTTNLVQPLPVDPDDGLPLFLPGYYRLMDEEEDEDYAVQGARGCTLHSEGTFFFPPERVRNIELALQNAGYAYWPMVAVLNIVPQVFEDLIVTVEVSDCMAKDVETFPLVVVNYPITNYPPVFEDLDDQVASVGELFTYPISAIDPDSCILSPASQHPAADQFSLTFNMTLGGRPSYQYGPWQEQLINPITGLVSFFPQFEGIYPAVVMVTDNRGYYSIGEFAIICANRGTWLNHNPVVLGDWDHPQVSRAGDLFVLSAPTFDVVDPDGDKLYYSCNIGAIGEDADGHVIWTMQTNFPGWYLVEIVAYDIRGGFAVVNMELEVRPWWSM